MFYFIGGGEFIDNPENGCGTPNGNADCKHQNNRDYAECNSFSFAFFLGFAAPVIIRNVFKVVNGFFNSKSRAESWGNNLYGYFVYPHSSEDPFYTCYGAGWRGSEEKYEGADENKFKETVVKILENHVHLKNK